VLKNCTWRCVYLKMSNPVYHGGGSVYLWLYSACGPWPLFQSVGHLGRGIIPSQVRYLHRKAQKQNKSIQTSVPRVELKPMIPAIERAKTVHVLDHAATVIGWEVTFQISPFLKAACNKSCKLFLSLCWMEGNNFSTIKCPKQLQASYQYNTLKKKTY
jgi:hypothetical protein